MKINFKIQEILAITGGTARGNTTSVISHINSIDNAGKGEITFFSDKKYLKYLMNSHASAVIVPIETNMEPKSEQVFIEVENPYISVVKFINYVAKMGSSPLEGVHSSAVISAQSNVDKTAYIGENCVVDQGTSIGKNAVIQSNTVIGKDVIIGENTYIHPNVTICDRTEIGTGCIIYPGAVIGSSGFGYLENKDDGSYTAIAQIGKVILEDNVEVGANSTIDRAMIGVTRVRKGTKIDNLVHIAHNCDIGEHNGIAAQAGISGSVKTGNRNRIAGQVGIAGHLSIPDDVIIMAQSGISNNIKSPGIYFGSPAKPRITAFKIEAVLRQLPEIANEVNKIQKKLKNINPSREELPK